VSPALAVAQALVARGHPPDEIVFLGARRGLETRLVPAAGFPLVALPGRGIQRRLTWENVPAVAGIVAAVARALWLFVRRRPRVVVSVGGYASVPGAVAAIVLRVPLVLVVPDAHPGAALRLQARFAKASAVAFAGTPMPRAEVTGNPIRAEAAAVDRSPEGRRAARTALGVAQDATVVAVVGGSLGARRLNDAVLGALDAWGPRRALVVHHVVGSRDWADVIAQGPPDRSVWHPVEYEDRLPLVYAAADLVVGRSGANAVAELTAAGAPSVLVPSPHVTADHQTVNARAMVDAGAAVLVPDAELTPERLVAEVDALLADQGRLAAMGAGAAALGRPDAAERVAAIVERCAPR
jgi:UDP-N-acetylglucosamine--N-acetylmuramyl-(pentapeptide) pyrophosphoryl-undecaprenol N-acetylglucosamine transferase